MAFSAESPYFKSVLAVIMNTKEAGEQVCRIPHLYGHQYVGFANIRLWVVVDTLITVIIRRPRHCVHNLCLH